MLQCEEFPVFALLEIFGEKKEEKLLENDRQLLQ